MLGRITNEQFRMLSADYNSEQNSLKERIPQTVERIGMRLMLVLCLLVSFSIFIQPAYSATQATYYVDTVNGNDNSNGLTIDTAFRTIIKARDVVRTINSSMSGDIIVNLRSGTYTLSSAVTLGTSDSGTNGYNVIYRAYNGEKPVINGGQKITGWTRYDSLKNIYRASVGTQEFRQIYVNGKRGVMARNPNLTNERTGGMYGSGTI